MISILVKVVPGSSKDAVVGQLADHLKIKVSAPPEGGKANKSVISVLAKWLGISAKQISIKSGHQSQRKVVEIQAIDRQFYEQKLSRLSS